MGVCCHTVDAGRYECDVCTVLRAVGIPARVCEGAGHSGHSMSGLSTLGCTFRSRYGHGVRPGARTPSG